MQLMKLLSSENLLIGLRAARLRKVVFINIKGRCAAPDAYTDTLRQYRVSSNDENRSHKHSLLTVRGNGVTRFTLAHLKLASQGSLAHSDRHLKATRLAATRAVVFSKTRRHFALRLHCRPAAKSHCVLDLRIIRQPCGAFAVSEVEAVPKAGAEKVVDDRGSGKDRNRPQFKARLDLEQRVNSVPQNPASS
jgi:hypothetical protein